MMKKIFVSLAGFFFFFCFSYKANAYLRLPDIFSHNMILQQNQKIHFAGYAEPGQRIKVVVSWNKDTVKAVTRYDAKWSVDFITPVAGGPYEIIVIGDKTITITNILIGEVWLCSGQSNMEFNAAWHYNNYKEEIINANHPEIRFFHIQKKSAPYPQEDVRGKWEVCTPETVGSFSGVGYFFGRTIYENLHQAVGLIESCWGASPVATWTPEEVYKNNQRLAASAAKMLQRPWSPVKPAMAFNAMIAPITNFSIAGVIWYQGEANTKNASTYQEAFSDLIHSWRNLWEKQFPFYFVQISPFKYSTPYGAAVVREAQLKTYRRIPNTGMVVVTDITIDTGNIHPKNKQEVGKRLANWALSKTYDKAGINYSGPLYRSMEIKGNKIVIHFDFAKDGLMKKGNELTHFMIAGEDHEFVAASAQIHDSTIIVYSSKVKHPLAVRMGLTNMAIPNLFNTAGLPASPFRTNDWELK
jgi:sialate O-acetylesterase